MIAQLFGLPEITVKNCYRTLRESGLVPIAGRGPKSSAPMTSETAAKLLIGICGSRYERESADKILGEFSHLVAVSGRFKAYYMREDAETDARYRFAEKSVPLLEELGERHTFLEGLTALIESAVLGHLPFRRKTGAGWRHANDVTVTITIDTSPTLHATVDIILRGKGDGSYATCAVEYDDERREDLTHEELLSVYDEIDLTSTRTFRHPTIIAVAGLIRGEAVADGRTSS